MIGRDEEHCAAQDAGLPIRRQKCTQVPIEDLHEMLFDRHMREEKVACHVRFRQVDHRDARVVHPFECPQRVIHRPVIFNPYHSTVQLPDRTPRWGLESAHPNANCSRRPAVDDAVPLPVATQRSW